MDVVDVLRSLEPSPDTRADPAPHGIPGRSTLTSRLTPAPQIVFRVTDPETARALGTSLSAGARVQREATGEAGLARDANGVADGAEEAVAQAARSSGVPLRADLRERFEASLGADLSAVRVHTGGESAEASRAVGAHAYTVGSDIHFGAGKYQPDDPFGMHLLAHEVAHTVQQAGGSAHRQHKLEVSQPQDALEAEADRAADAMVAGRPADLGSAVVLSRKIHRDVDYGTLQGAGDEAEAKAAKAPLAIDSASVTADRSRVGEIIAEIDKNQGVLAEAEKHDDTLAARFAPLVTNATTKANLQIFDDSLGVTAVDTAGFALQFRTAYADYQRLTAEGQEYLSLLGVNASGPVDTLSDGFDAMGKNSLKMGESQAGLTRFRAARQNLNTAATKMDGEMKAFRGAAQGLQGALYAAKGKAAAAKGAEAATKLAAVKAEIDAMAKGVGTAIKVASAVAGFVGTGGEVGKVATDAFAAGEPAGGKALAKAFFKDADAISQQQLSGIDLGGITVGTIASGDPAGIAEGLVKVIGNQLNKEKIAGLQQAIATAGAEEASFNAAAEASTFAAHQTNMEAAATKLKTLVLAYDQAKVEMREAGDALMAELSKDGKKGKDQAKAVLFLTDSDRFLAQATSAITAGEHQQANAKTAADKRKALRGTTSTVEAEKDQAAQRYWTATKTTVPGKLWGTNDSFQLRSVFVTFTGSGAGGYNDIVQGGSGSVEGAGGAADEVARKLETLKEARTQVQKLQAKIQNVLGTGGPGLTA